MCVKGMKSDFDFSNEVSLVTGAGRGIGLAISEKLADLGSTVALMARSSEELQIAANEIRTRGGNAHVFSCDVSDLDNVKQNVEEIENRLGPIKYLVNNAGVTGAAGRDWEVDPLQWWRTMEINVKGAFNCGHVVLKHMVERRQGRIVNVSSSSAELIIPFMSSYGVSKAALTHLTASTAEAAGEFGISIFSYCPGLVRTKMTDYMEKTNDLPIIARQGMMDAFNSGKNVQPSYSAEGVAYLLSGKADVLSGRHLDVREDLEGLVRKSKDIIEKDLLRLRIPR